MQKSIVNNNDVSAHKQSALIWRQFTKHRLAVFSLFVLLLLYTVGVIFPEFFAPYLKQYRTDQNYTPPTKVRFIDVDGNFHMRPFIYRTEQNMNAETWELEYIADTSKMYPIHFIVHGQEYEFLGLFKTDLHLFGVEEEANLFILGTDSLGRDLFSRTIYACRISLTIGFVGTFISLVLGLLIGGLAGLLGGVFDDIIQRIIEMLMSIPKIPMWMALSAAIPQNWSALQIYFAITIILSFLGWTGLARVVRSKFLSIREEDFINAAISYNSPIWTIIVRHMIPNFITYVIVSVTLAIPAMILAETSLSFLGIGLQPPIVSLGVLLQQAQQFQTVQLYPWILIPGFIVVFVVLAYNFVGDGLRDAADPYN